jgi:hypothetical protein
MLELIINRRSISPLSVIRNETINHSNTQYECGREVNRFLTSYELSMKKKRLTVTVYLYIHLTNFDIIIND